MQNENENLRLEGEKVHALVSEVQSNEITIARLEEEYSRLEVIVALKDKELRDKQQSFEETNNSLSKQLQQFKEERINLASNLKEL